MLTASAQRRSLSTVLTPVEDAERLPLLDFLRGFALLGIVLMKAADFSPMFWEQWPRMTDRATAWAMETFVAAKFWTLFSFLFGVGFAVQLQRASARGAPFARFFARRALVLLAIGLLHGLLIWGGDILAGYAIAALLLLLFRDAANRTLLAAASALWVLPYVARVVRRDVLGLPPPARPDPAALTELYSSGSAAAIWRAEVRETLDYLMQGLVGPNMWIAHTLVLFLLGFYAVRAGVIHRLATERSYAARVLLVSVSLALMGRFGAELLGERLPSVTSVAYRLPRALLFGALGFAETWGLAAAYAAVVALAVAPPVARSALAPLAATGRMALTNYLAQSVVFVLLYYNYGLGLAGRVRPSAGVAISLAVFAAQAFASAWWLSRFRFGPVEWMWRTLTYGTRPPLRRAA